MRRLSGMSLRRRFVMALAAYGAALAAVLGFVSHRIAKDALERELDRRLTDVAGAVGAVGIRTDAVLAFGPGYEDELAYTSHRERLQALLPFVDRAFIFNAANRRLLVSSDATPIGTELYFLQNYLDEIVEAHDRGRSTTRVFPDVDGRPMKYGFVRLQAGQPAILGVLMPADYLAPVGRLEAALLWGSGGALLVAVLLGALLAASVAAPLEQLSRAALRIQRGRLDRPVPVEGEDEVGRLARAMERMREAILQRDAQLRLMLAQVAHELRNPLGGLELFASAAASAEDPRERRRLIERVHAEVATLTAIIDDFLTFARPLDPEYHPVDVRRAVEDAAELSRGEVEQHGGSLEVALPPDPLVAHADREQVKRAVLNLLRNASHAGRRVRVWAEEEQGEIMIAVMDDGPGVTPSLRDRIFDPFVTDKEKGAGLGLSIVKKVADAHGGRVEVRRASDPGFGEGAEFRLYLEGSAEASLVAEPTSVRSHSGAERATAGNPWPRS